MLDAARARSSLVGEIVSGSRHNYYRMMAAVAIRGTTYPVVLPKLRDPRLHLAATITSLQVLGQVAFDFRLSIAQILVCLVTCAVIEVTIVMRKQHVLMWPASALLTGNGVAFVLRVPGTVHGDWWSMNGWWIFAGTAAGALLSKYVIAWRGQHVFNPSNIGLVVCFLALGRARVEPLDFWWGPMSWWMVLALAIIVTGGFTILRRLQPAADRARVLGVVRRRDRCARAHRPRDDGSLAPRADHRIPLLVGARHLAGGARVPLLHDHRPEDGAVGRQGAGGYALALGLVAGTLIAPTTTELSAKVALLSSLAIVCAAKFVLAALPLRVDRRRVVLAAAAGIAAFAGVRRALERDGRRRRRPAAAARAPAADHDPAFARRADAARPAHGAADRALPRRGGPGARRRHGYECISCAGTDQGPPSPSPSSPGARTALTPTAGGGWALPAAQPQRRRSRPRAAALARRTS